MVSYKRENGGNDKLMGWEGGIIAKEKASWSRTSTSQILHLDFINSRASSTNCLHSKDFPIFSNPYKREEESINRKEAILGFIMQLTCVPSEFSLKKLKRISLPSLLNSQNHFPFFFTFPRVKISAKDKILIIDSWICQF